MPAHHAASAQNEAETKEKEIPSALNRLARQLIVAFASAQVTVVERDGFDWADAGIGALGAFGVTFVLAGVALLVRTPAFRAERRAGSKRKRRSL